MNALCEECGQNRCSQIDYQENTTKQTRQDEFVGNVAIVLHNKYRISIVLTVQKDE